MADLKSFVSSFSGANWLIDWKKISTRFCEIIKLNSASRVGDECSGLFEDNGEMKWFTGKIIKEKNQESHYGRFKVKWETDDAESDHSCWELSSNPNENEEG